jgi:hypothetical protein
MFAFGIQESFVMPKLEHPSGSKSLKKTRNERNMGLDRERGLEIFFSKQLKQTITHPLPCAFSLAYGAQRTFVTL